MRLAARRPEGYVSAVRGLAATFALTAVLMTALLLDGRTAAAAHLLPNGRWDVTGTYAHYGDCLSGCGGRWDHVMTLAQRPGSSGEITGSGYYIPDPSYTWNVTGTVTGSSVRLSTVHTGSNAGYTATFIGSISSDGSLSGTWTDSNGASGAWRSTEIPPDEIFKNHGQEVKQAGDKQAAAHKFP
jgi:hypothetical protein